MKNCCSHIILLCLVITLASCGRDDALPSLEETYSRKDKAPFGAYVMHHQLEQLFYRNTVNPVKRNFEAFWNAAEDTGAVYVNISRSLFLSKADLTSMLSFVYRGNSLFISSGRIDKALLDTLGCMVKKDSYDEFFPEMKYTSVEVSDTIYHDPAVYQYYYVPFYNHFSKFNKEDALVLGKNAFGPNYLLIFYGRGRFYLHLEPRALSNYFLLQKDNFNYFNHLFSFTPAIPEHVYWDDYNHKINFRPSAEGNRSSLSVLLKYPGMAWAFWLLLLFAALYIFFGGKRRQRVVPTLIPNTNTTLAFTETIGRLYLQKKDNRNIADKLITYFMEHIRNQYYLNTSHLDEAFIATLSRKANHSPEKMEALLTSIRNIQQSAQVSDQELLSLNQQLEHFYKTKA
jgi:hypothetical protein